MTTDAERLMLARVSLDGLSVGDALGETCSYSYYNARKRILSGVLPPKPWWYTDDTALALAIYEHLATNHCVEQDRLALDMADRYRRDPDRGYGKMARMILQKISSGEDWRKLSKQAFSGGSMGNGAAMRVAPLGAYFADDLSKTVEQAKASAEITHSHPEGIAGAAAVAIAAAMATQCRKIPVDTARRRIHEAAVRLTPAGATRRALELALSFSIEEQPKIVAQQVGNGSLVISADTVPFCIWNACRCLDNYQEAFISTVEVGGDCDTNCAIVGGIVAAYTGVDGIPPLWLERRERLDVREIGELRPDNV